MNLAYIDIDISVTSKYCKHLLIDAGHMAIESDLADKDAIRAVHLKRNQQYSDEDHKRLEGLMYDKVSLKLKDAQVSVKWFLSEFFSRSMVSTVHPW